VQEIWQEFQRTWDSPDIAMVAVEQREIDWASRSSHEESEVGIKIAVLTEQMHGSDRNSDLN
jgi:hypothetical protein